MKLKTFTVVFFLIMSMTTFAQKQNEGCPAEQYKTMSDNGAWCWFSDPRAVSLNGKIYSGWVSCEGNIMVGSYNIKTGDIKTVDLYPGFDKDDHATPSFLILPDKKIMVFFSAHSRIGNGEKVASILYSTTKNPEDITQWEPLSRKTENVKGNRSFCYNNPVMLSEENNRIYVFWRGADWKPTFSYTDNFGKTWSKSSTLVKSSLNPSKRPYTKVYSNGKDEIYFAFTDGHPREEALNSIYYMKYKKGKFYKADGTVVGTMETLPVEHEQCDVVYDSPKAFKTTNNAVRSWIWDVAIDNSGNPVMAYTRLPEETKHEYYYAKWNGTSWLNYKVSAGGDCFPRYPKTKSMRNPEPHYSGGICIDHENANIVYYSKPVGDIFEIFKAETNNNGKSWKETAITYNSKKDNVRPFAIRGAGDNEKIQILWMYNDRYVHYEDFNARIKIEKKK